MSDAPGDSYVAQRAWPYASNSGTILERLDKARDRALATCERSLELQRAIATSLHEAQRSRQSVVEQRRLMLLGRTPLFLVCGFVEDEPVEARWVPGHGLMCPPPLLERAVLVVDLGEMFSSLQDGPNVPAALDTPVAAMLTVMRAMSRIRSLDMSYD